MLLLIGGVSWGQGGSQGLVLGSGGFQVLVPVEVLVLEGVCVGALLSPFGVCPWAGGLTLNPTLKGVFTKTCETVVMELSVPLRQVAVFLRVGAVMAEFCGGRFCVVRSWFNFWPGTLTFFFRLRPLPPLLPLLVFLLRTLFFLFPEVGVARVVQFGDAHRGRTPTEAV